MAWSHGFDSHIRLDGSSRISREDAERQAQTAKEILRRFSSTPGQILADEVGMGKTFVALAVAASVALHDKRPVVIMVPLAVLEKWQRDLSVFVENCLNESTRKKISIGVANNGVDFLKYLDDPEGRRKQIIFLAHGALSRNLSDAWVKLAILQRAMKFRKNATAEYRSMARYAGSLLWMKYLEKNHKGLWGMLLNRQPSKWMNIINREFKNDEARKLNDDPVPRHVMEALDSPELKPLFDDLWAEIQRLPKRKSSKLNSRINKIRSKIQIILPKIWQFCFLKSNIHMPLLILDEAHHLKNARTRLASMFHSSEAEGDANAISKGGQLAGVFERMLFLTATPFQLGHHELCSILERFEGISWGSAVSPEGGRLSYEDRLKDLREKLDESQRKAKILEREWGKLDESDLNFKGRVFSSNEIDDWWQAIEESDVKSDAISRVQEIICLSADSLNAANDELKQLVVRHMRPGSLTPKLTHIPRRRKLTGRAVVDHDDTHADIESEGLPIEGETALPFLLAARFVALTPSKRPVTAEGLASSYETFLETRKNLIEGRNAAEIDDDSNDEQIEISSGTNWYLRHIQKAIRPDDRVLSELHPKIGPIVDKVVELWGKGEKVLVFCHYVKTGRALRTHISHKIREKLYEQASVKLSCDMADVEEKLRNMGIRFREGSGLRNRAEELIEELISPFDNLKDQHDLLVDIIHRFMRTPTFLVRYFEFAGSRVKPETLHKAFEYKVDRGLSLNELLKNFFKFMDDLTSEERKAYIDALDSIQTGDISLKSDADSEDEKRDAVIAAVRLINGSVKNESRQHLMLSFNTPFYPEILVASSVLAEGVDLHLNCRHLIHYDLSWNPSDLEQRTGRVDRIGAKAEKVQQPIYVYYPYLAGTQDEKMYRVVMDRDRWFNVVMGGAFKVDYETTEKISERIPLPSQVLKRLKLDLSV